MADGRPTGPVPKVERIRSQEHREEHHGHRPRPRPARRSPATPRRASRSTPQSELGDSAVTDCSRARSTGLTAAGSRAARKPRSCCSNRSSVIARSPRGARPSFAVVEARGAGGISRCPRRFRVGTANWGRSGRRSSAARRHRLSGSSRANARSSSSRSPARCRCRAAHERQSGVGGPSAGIATMIGRRRRARSRSRQPLTGTDRTTPRTGPAREAGEATPGNDGGVMHRILGLTGRPGSRRRAGSGLGPRSSKAANAVARSSMVAGTVRLASTRLPPTGLGSFART